MLKNRSLVVLTILAVCALAAVLWWILKPRAPTDLLTLYGNVDLRQVELAFNGSDRIEAVLAQEGDHVIRGQTLARLDTGRLNPQVQELEAQTAAQAAAVAKLHAGQRPQEIAQARAGFAEASDEATNAKTQYDRMSSLWTASGGQAAVSKQNVDDARTAMRSADARLEVQRKSYELAVLGPRREDIEQAEALLKADQARLALLRRQLADATLGAPVNAVVRARLMEPGEMASPQRPVFTLAQLDPKWVRAYVTAVDLPRVRPGAAASVTVDAFPSRTFPGRVGFISSVAEFTPKTVQTTELRTSLVYEVRVFVTDPGDDLRLGMPATVQIHLAPAEARR
jgi:HlyD family secretion protein